MSLFCCPSFSYVSCSALVAVVALATGEAPRPGAGGPCGRAVRPSGSRKALAQQVRVLDAARIIPLPAAGRAVLAQRELPAGRPRAGRPGPVDQHRGGPSASGRCRSCRAESRVHAGGRRMRGRRGPGRGRRRVLRWGERPARSAGRRGAGPRVSDRLCGPGNARGPGPDRRPLDRHSDERRHRGHAVPLAPARRARPRRLRPRASTARARFRGSRSSTRPAATTRASPGSCAACAAGATRRSRG